MPPHSIETNSVAQTQACAAQYACALQPGAIVALCGPLGAGKTSFVQGFAHGLGVPSNIRVNSPTFALLNIYAGRLPIYHFDWYRLEHAAALQQIDVDEYLAGDGVCVIEWADKFSNILPATAQHIQFEILGATRRRLVFT